MIFVYFMTLELVFLLDFFFIFDISGCVGKK